MGFRPDDTRDLKPLIPLSNSIGPALPMHRCLYQRLFPSNSGLRRPPDLSTIRSRHRIRFHHNPIRASPNEATHSAIKTKRKERVHTERSENMNPISTLLTIILGIASVLSTWKITRDLRHWYDGYQEDQFRKYSTPIKAIIVSLQKNRDGRRENAIDVLHGENCPREGVGNLFCH